MDLEKTAVASVDSPSGEGAGNVQVTSTTLEESKSNSPHSKSEGNLEEDPASSDVKGRLAK